MSAYLASASVLCALVSLCHSVIGEWMIFRSMRRRGGVPTHAGPGLREFQLRIIWATWHVVSLLGAALAVMLWSFATNVRAEVVWLSVIACAFAGSGLLVAYATRGKHPAWIALLLIAGLVAMS